MPYTNGSIIGNINDAKRKYNQKIRYHILERSTVNWTTKNNIRLTLAVNPAMLD
jgi:hypothetical protein